MIPQDFLARVIAATDIVALISARVQLRKQGKDYAGLCPFHDEKSRSFNVSAEKRFYYCFGCGAHGNVIGFLMQYEHLPFVDAVTSLAHALGWELPVLGSERVEQQDTKADLSLLFKISQYYQRQLKMEQKAIAYLKSRGLTGKIAHHFQLGFAPPAWDSVVQLCGMLDSADLELAIRNGLVVQKDNANKEHRHYYDRFRDRIMFPIRNVVGDIIAFGARTLGNDTPKYLNSPETPLFHKSHELYGLYELLQHSRTPAHIIVVEGYMDVIALHQYGVTQAVATLGTATNASHLKKLFRYTKEIIFCFDGDSAGQKAAWRALTTHLVSMHDGVQMRFMFLPAEDDPDSLIRRVGATGFLQRLQRAEPLSTVFFDLLKQQEMPSNIQDHTPDAKAMFAEKALHYLHQIPQGIFRELMINELAKQMNLYVSHFNQVNQKKAPARSTPALHSVLTPVQKATALLLQEPKLCYEGFSATELMDLSEMNFPGLKLFVELVELLRAQPALSIGEILNYFTQENTQQEIAMLAARAFPFTPEGMLVEFRDTIQTFKKQCHALERAGLIQQSKQAALSAEQKNRLRVLWAEKHGIESIITSLPGSDSQGE